ncbi:MAG: prevent-host-death family protein [Gemmataceae bacterium]|nr:prevent-host-death family protein [Gemmataceae bacterium]
MQTATVEEVQARLPEILAHLAPGEEVVITRAGVPIAKLLPELPKGVPMPGRGKGKVLYMAPDFDAPLDDFKEYVG